MAIDEFTDLYAKAEAATPVGHTIRYSNGAGELVCRRRGNNGQRIAQISTLADREYYSAANPTAILSLINTLREARDQIEDLTHKQCVVRGALRYDGFGDWWCNLKHPNVNLPKDFGPTIPGLGAELSTLRARVAEVEAQNERLRGEVASLNGVILATLPILTPPETKP